MSGIVDIQKPEGLGGNLSVIKNWQQTRVEGKGLDAEISKLPNSVLFEYRAHKESAGRKGPVIILIPGIRNHPNEMTSLIPDLINEGNAPVVYKLHFPYDKPLDVEGYLHDLGQLIEQNHSVVLCGSCLGANIAIEMATRLSPELLSKIQGLMCLSPTLSTGLKFVGRMSKTLAGIGSKLSPAATDMKSVRRLMGYAIGDVPNMSNYNALQLFDVEQHLTFFSGKTECPKIPNVAVSWVGPRMEFGTEQMMANMEAKISTLAIQDELHVVRDLPGLHGDLDKRRNRRAYSNARLAWYGRSYAV